MWCESKIIIRIVWFQYLISRYFQHSELLWRSVQKPSSHPKPETRISIYFLGAANTLMPRHKEDERQEGALGTRGIAVTELQRNQRQNLIHFPTHSILMLSSWHRIPPLPGSSWDTATSPLAVVITHMSGLQALLSSLVNMKNPIMSAENGEPSEKWGWLYSTYWIKKILWKLQPHCNVIANQAHIWALDMCIS